MTVLGASDVTAMIADLAIAGGTVAVVLGANTVQGLYDREAAELLGGEMPGSVSSDEAVHVVTGSLAGLAAGASVTVGGVSYKVRELTPYGDGAMTRVALRKP